MFSFVQESHGSNYSGASATTIATAAAAHSAGSFLGVCTRAATVGTQVLTVTDTAGSTYRRVGRSTLAGSMLELWCAQDSPGHATNVVTVTYNGSVAFRGVICGEFVADAPVLVDQIPSITGERTTPSSGVIVTPAFTTLIADELILSAAQVDVLASVWTADSGFSTAFSDGTLFMQYRVVSSIQTAATVTATNNTNNGRDILAATFVESGGGGGGGSSEVGFAS